MESPERMRRLIFLYPEYKPNTISLLDPKENTFEDNKRILNEHIGRDSTFGIGNNEGTFIISPSEFRKAARSQESREKFISSLAGLMEDAEIIAIDSPVSFSNN